MDVKKVIATAPFARRMWRRLPGPLKIVAVAGALVMWYRGRKEEQEAGDGGPQEARD